jgi:hypothetical protein
MLVLATGITGTSTPAAADEKLNRSRTVLRDYAACLISDYDRPLAGDRQRPTVRYVERFLATPPFSPAAGEAGKQLNTSACVKGRNGAEYLSLRFPTDLLRGALFRAKYLRLAPQQRGAVSFPPYSVDAAWHIKQPDPYAVLQAIGECTVRENPDDARVAITSQPGSDEEGAAYAALTPALSRCIPQEGTYTFSRARLESLMAEAFFYLSGGEVPDPVT